MWPLADLLIRFPAQLHAGLDVTHIPHCDLVDTLLRAEFYHLARRLVESIALLEGTERARRVVATITGDLSGRVNTEASLDVAAGS
jgi:hypothetical protein